MRRTLELSQGISLVLSQGELGYQAVLDTLPEAQQFTVVTYNISRRDSKLLKLLGTLDGTLEFRVLTNIPSRYSSYWGDGPRLKAREAIDAYIANLNPSKFAARMQSFFRFDNHCKLIATDTVAYVGSANFSDESSGNLEVGVLIEGREAVRHVVDLIWEEAKVGAHEHGNNAVSDATTRLKAVKARIGQVRRDLHDLFFTESDNDYGRSIEYFRWEECLADRADLDGIVDLLEENKEVLSNLSDHEGLVRAIGEIDFGPIDDIQRLLAPDGPIDVFVTHDPQRFMMAEVEGALYDDYDEACQDAADEEGGERQRLADDAERDVQAAEASLAQLMAELDRLEEILHNVQVPNPALDNTR
jgi:hypothetical protein